MSRPDFLHKGVPVVINTEGEKVGKMGKRVDSDYVKRFCISTGVVDCGKLLWKRLWRMWKTMSFQQVFGPFPKSQGAVDKCVYRVV